MNHLLQVRLILPAGRRLIRAAHGIAVTVMVLLLNGCSSTGLLLNYDHAANFSAWKTYAWLGKAPDKTGDARIDDSQVVRARLRKAIDAQLGAKGFHSVQVEDADFLVGYQLEVREEARTSTIETDPSMEPEHESFLERSLASSYVSEKEIVSLSVDIVDPKGKKVVWDGTIQRGVSNTSSLPRLATQLEAEVAAVMKKFPPSQQTK